MVLAAIANVILRVAQVAFAAIVAGVNGSYIADISRRPGRFPARPMARFIYAEVVAAISILFALIFLFPVYGIHFGFDLLMCILWFVAFGLLVAQIDNTCGWVFDWRGVTVLGNDICGRWKAIIAFAFLSGIVWLASAIVGACWVRDREKRTYSRRRWGGSRV